MLEKRYAIHTVHSYDISPYIMSTKSNRGSHPTLSQFFHSEEQAAKELNEATDIYSENVFTIVPVWIDPTVHATRCENQIIVSEQDQSE